MRPAASLWSGPPDRSASPSIGQVRAIRSNDCRSGTTSTRLSSDWYSGMSEPARSQENRDSGVSQITSRARQARSASASGCGSCPLPRPSPRIKTVVRRFTSPPTAACRSGSSRYRVPRAPGSEELDGDDQYDDPANQKTEARDSQEGFAGGAGFGAVQVVEHPVVGTVDATGGRTPPTAFAGECERWRRCQSRRG